MVESRSSCLAVLNTMMGEARSKVAVVLAVAFALVHRSRAGLTSLEGYGLQEQQGAAEDAHHGQSVSPEDGFQGQHQDSVASSYVMFNGPVAGPEFEVKVRSSHQGDDNNYLHGQEQSEHEHAVDYVAHPKYQFSYGVEDHRTGDFHEQKETRDGNSVTGEYSVKEPGGSVRVVKYLADEDGFRAVVHISGERDHSTVYGGQGHDQVQVHQVTSHRQQQQDDDDYVASYASDEGH